MSNKLDIFWNSSVSKVGGRYNSISNFRKISEEFFKIGKTKGFKEEDLYDYAKGNFDSVFMRW